MASSSSAARSLSSSSGEGSTRKSAGWPAVERVGAPGEQAGEPLVDHQAPPFEALVDLGLVEDQLPVELAEATLLVVLSQAPEPPPVGEHALEDRDLGASLELRR